MSDAYPVQVEVTSPPKFERIQLLLRLVLAIVLGWFGITAGWLAWLLYLALPVIAAITVSTVGRERYLRDFAPELWRVLTWLLQLSAYMMLLVDRFPTGSDGDVQPQIRMTASPTIGSALLRLVTSFPSALVLMLLSLLSGLLWIVGAALLLFTTEVPPSILAFQRGVLRWQARLVAYHASFVDEYPPFSFDTEITHGLHERATPDAPDAHAAPR